MSKAQSSKIGARTGPAFSYASPEERTRAPSAPHQPMDHAWSWAVIFVVQINKKCHWSQPSFKHGTHILAFQVTWMLWDVIGCKVTSSGGPSGAERVEITLHVAQTDSFFVPSREKKHLNVKYFCQWLCMPVAHASEMPREKRPSGIDLGICSTNVRDGSSWFSLLWRG